MRHAAWGVMVLSSRMCRSLLAAGAQTYFFYGSTAISQLFHHVHVTGIPYGQKCAPCDMHDAAFMMRDAAAAASHMYRSAS